MPELRSYPKNNVPRDIACQIRSGIRMVWPGLNAGWNKIWTPPPGVPLDRMTFVLVEDELLISHAEVNFRTIEHGGQTCEVGGLSAVFTYPAHRGTGAGEQVVRVATEYLRGSKADLALLFCGQSVQSLYFRTGWEHLPAARIYYGDKANPTLDDKSLVMALFITNRARSARPAWESKSVYVGPSTW